MDAQAGANTPGWLHHPATQLEQASTDVLEKKMTTPAPDYLRALAVVPKRLGDGWRISAVAALHQSADALAAVTADRDAYVYLLRKTEDELHASKQMHEQARSLLDQTLTERDKLREQLADAPHDWAGCGLVRAQQRTDVCTCWKAAL